LIVQEEHVKDAKDMFRAVQESSPEKRQTAEVGRRAGDTSGATARIRATDESGWPANCHGQEGVTDTHRKMQM
jgi:hypothetical protein